MHPNQFVLNFIKSKIHNGATAILNTTGEQRITSRKPPAFFTEIHQPTMIWIFEHPVVDLRLIICNRGCHLDHRLAWPLIYPTEMSRNLMKASRNGKNRDGLHPVPKPVALLLAFYRTDLLVRFSLMCGKLHSQGIDLRGQLSVLSIYFIIQVLPHSLNHFC